MQLSGSLRVLIDCSTFLSGAFYPSGKPHKILERWVQREFELFITEEIYGEYQTKIEEVAKRMKVDPKKGDLWFRLIEKRAVFIKPTVLPQDLCRDPNDLKYLEATMAAEADFLISSDKDLLTLKKFGKTKIVSPDKFLQMS